jgi:hypothetical protein
MDKQTNTNIKTKDGFSYAYPDYQEKEIMKTIDKKDFSNTFKPELINQKISAIAELTDTSLFIELD